MSLSLIEHCRQRLKEIEEAGLLRRLREWEHPDARTVRLSGRELLNFSSNNYLGLAAHPRVRGAINLSSDVAVGATASRLITGNHSAYERLEKEIATFKKAASALVFTSGYAAVLGTIPALVGPGDFIVMDKLCHACLVDGARLSGATLRIFPHNHLKRCKELLKNCHSKAEHHAKILLITESVFSMDGDLAPLSDLVELKKKYGAWLMIDEAHATGVLGTNGRGGAEHFGVENEIEISVGTLSKAIGCVGGFISGSQELREFLVNRARSFIYSTGLPSSICMAAAEAIGLACNDPSFRKKLWENIKLLKDKLGLQMQSPILPVLIGDERLCVEVAEKLRELGFMIPAVRYPTVARGKARLRISLSAAHTEEDITRLSQALQRFL